MNPLLFACLALGLGAPPPPAPAPQPTTSDLHGDVDGDGRPDVLRFAGDAAGAHAVLSLERGRGAAWASPVYPAWKAALGPLERGAPALVVLGIWTTKHRHPGPAIQRTVWVLGWDATSDHMVERWRGSALARPFDDFSVGDLDGDGQAELLVLEHATSCQLAAYRWQGFGFTGLGKGPVACAARLCDDGSACVDSDGRRRRVRLAHHRLSLEDP
ncbi:MAG: hypothetical protein U1F43_34920 [Myxococcota bacterium]